MHNGTYPMGAVLAYTCDYNSELDKEFAVTFECVEEKQGTNHTVFWKNYTSDCIGEFQCSFTW